MELIQFLPGLFVTFMFLLQVLLRVLQLCNEHTHLAFEPFEDLLVRSFQLLILPLELLIERFQHFDLILKPGLVLYGLQLDLQIVPQFLGIFFLQDLVVGVVAFGDQVEHFVLAHEAQTAVLFFDKCGFELIDTALQLPILVVFLPEPSN